MRRSHGPYHGRLQVTKRGSEVMHISWRSGNSTGNSSMAVDRCVGRLSDEPSVEFCVDTDGSTSSSRPLFSRALNSMRKSGRGRASAPPSSSSAPSTSGISSPSPLGPPLPLRLRGESALSFDTARRAGRVGWAPRHGGDVAAALPIVVTMGRAHPCSKWLSDHNEKNVMLV